MHIIKNKVLEEDFLAFYVHHLKKTMLKPFSIGLYVVFILFLLIGPIVSRNYGMYIYLALFVVIAVYIVKSIPRKAKKLYHQNQDAFQMTYTLKEDALVFETTQGKNEKLWSEFHTLYETEDHFFIYLKSKKGLVFVKRNMKEDQVTFLLDKCMKVMSEKNMKLLQK